MAYQIHQIIEGKGSPISVTKDDTVSKALSLMIEHDYSQLPVISREEKAKDMTIDTPEGMVTYESILRGIRNFQAKIEELKIQDVMISAPIYSYDDDLFDIFDRLKDSNAVLITEDIGLGEDLVGIVTSYDATEYFRNRTEDMMRVEDIELIIKDFILGIYLKDDGEIDEQIKKVKFPKPPIEYQDKMAKLFSEFIYAIETIDIRLEQQKEFKKKLLANFLE